MKNRLPLLPLLPMLSLLACQSPSIEVAQQESLPLTVTGKCATTELPADAWTCGATLEVECDNRGGAEVTLYAPPADGCSTGAAASPSTIDEPGQYTVSVVDAEGQQAVCQGTLVVLDTTPPALTAKTVELWPPNHKLHTLRPADCVSVVDTCDDEVRLSFTYATSNEAANTTGDGNTDADIVALGCDSVQLRAERSGKGEGRVYSLGVRATDASGNSTLGECVVVVPHDKGKASATPKEASVVTRVDAPACAE